MLKMFIMKKTTPTPDIASPTNAKFKAWKTLLTSQGIKKNSLFLMGGEKITSELQSSAGKNRAAEVESWLVSSENAEHDMATLKGIPRREIFVLEKALFSELNEMNTQGPLAVVKRPDLQKIDLSQPPQGLELILSLQDPSNLGAALRVAEAFHAQKVILLQECAEPFLPKCSRSSSGSNLRVSLYQGPSLKTLESHLEWVTSQWVALDLKGQLLPQFEWPQNARLLLGVEGPGLSPRLKESPHLKKVRIPIRESVDSLNAVSALSIACYSYGVQFSNP